MSDPLIRIVRPGQMRRIIPALSEVLIDCVKAGAPVGFMADIDAASADAFWAGLVDDVGRERIVLLVAEDEQGICGTVYLGLVHDASHTHRANIRKLLVHPRVRKQGVAKGMLTTLEMAARAAGRSLLIGSAPAESAGEKMYIALGWTEAGFVPGYTLNPDGSPADMAFYYKELV